MPPASVKAAQVRRDKEKKRADVKSLLSFDEDLAGGEVAASSKQTTAPPRPRSSLRAPSALKTGELPTSAPSTQVSSAGKCLKGDSLLLHKHLPKLVQLSSKE